LNGAAGGLRRAVAGARHECTPISDDFSADLAIGDAVALIIDLTYLALCGTLQSVCWMRWPISFCLAGWGIAFVLQARRTGVAALADHSPVSEERAVG
jgi:hypothetical protein